MRRCRKTDTFENDYRMLKYFQDEFVYRHQNFWNSCNRFFIFTIATILIPVVSDIFGLSFNNSINKLPLFLFPLTGIVASVLTFFILKKEAQWLRDANKAKETINRRMHKDYQYPYIAREKNNKQKRLPMTIYIPFSLMIIEILLAITVLIVLLTGQQTSAVEPAKVTVLYSLSHC